MQVFPSVAPLVVSLFFLSVNNFGTAAQRLLAYVPRLSAFVGEGRSVIDQRESTGQRALKEQHNASISLSSGKSNQRAGKFTKRRRRGLLQISKTELAAYMRQKRTSWEAGVWRTQAADLIDVALQKAECLSKQWPAFWSMSGELHR